MLWPCFLFLDFTKAHVSFPPAKVFHARDAATPPSLALLKWVYPSFWVPQRNISLVGHGGTSIFSSPKLAVNWGNPPSYGQTPACNGNFTSRVSVQSFQNCIFFRKFEGFQCISTYKYMPHCWVLVLFLSLLLFVPVPYSLPCCCWLSCRSRLVLLCSLVTWPPEWSLGITARWWWTIGPSSLIELLISESTDYWMGKLR